MEVDAEEWVYYTLSMSDTPRTNLNHLTVETLRTLKGTGTKIVLASVSRQLERELAAANERIRRLEAAGNAMHHEMQFGEWRQGSPRSQAHAAMLAWHAEMGGRL